MSGDVNNNEDNQIFAKISDALQKEHACEWGKASFSYSQVIKLIDQQLPTPYVDDRSTLSELEKDQAIECWVGYLRCRLAISGLGEDVKFFDTGREAMGELKRVEEEIGTYRIKNPSKSWNKLHIVYSALESEYREKGMPMTSDALHYFAMKARMKLYFWATLRSGGRRFWSARQFVSLFISWMITGFRRNIWRPVIVLTLPTIFIWAFAYWASSLFPNQILLPEKINGFLSSLCYSIFTFTGAGPADWNTTLSWNYLLAAIEVIVGYIITVVALGYLFNQSSSEGIQTREPTKPK